ncbi:MAG: phosphatidylglycerol lysyltransferase domain-containing protein [Paenisporosarcina sp.]
MVQGGIELKLEIVSLYLIYFSLLTVVIYAFYLNKKSSKEFTPNKIEEFNDRMLQTFLMTHGGNHISHLIFLKDKQLFWSKDQKVLIAYKITFNRAIVLGDPIGESSFFQEAINEFFKDCKRKGLKPLFYQISPTHMHLYQESGYRLMKLGEEGKVTLPTYTLEGKQGAKLRTTSNKFSRLGYTFRVVTPPYSDAFLEELTVVSNSWLGNQKEKGFSVVSFSKEYVERFPVALVYDSNGQAVAFVTLASDYRKTLIIDLMRKIPNSENGTMDFLFIHIMKWAKNHDYLSCSLGMAPLANVGNTKDSLLSEKLIHFMSSYRKSSYNIKGLKEFKSKFASVWEPKYLAYKGTFLPIALLQIYLVIHKTPVTQPIFVNKIKLLLKRAG